MAGITRFGERMASALASVSEYGSSNVERLVYDCFKACECSSSAWRTASWSLSALIFVVEISDLRGVKRSDTARD